MDLQKRCIFALLSVLFFNCEYSSGSKIILTASNPTIKPLLTPTLTLRCSLVDTSSSSSVIGRSISANPPNVKFVNSIFLFRNDQDIATVSEHMSAHAVNGAPNLRVSGAIPGQQGEKGFLEASISYPTEAEGGNYSCRISAIDDVGHPVILSDSADIDVASPTINDLVNHIKNQDQINNAKITSLQNQVLQLQNELNVTKHVEGGVVDCGGTLGSRTGDQISRTQAIQFSHPYRSKPIVHVAVHAIGINKDYYGYFHVHLVNVDTNGFTVECDVAKAHFLAYLEVSWLSIPA